MLQGRLCPVPPHTICRPAGSLLGEEKVPKYSREMSALGLGEKGGGQSVQTDELFSGPPVISKYQTHHFAKVGQKSDSPATRRQSSVWQRDLGRQQ